MNQESYERQQSQLTAQIIEAEKVRDEQTAESLLAQKQELLNEWKTQEAHS